jgi:GNAT superfamily N-acetyltransferase
MRPGHAPPYGGPVITYQWRASFDNAEISVLHADGFDHAVLTYDWWALPDELVGFVNVAWDGDSHAFILDTLVRRSAGRQGIGTMLVSLAAQEARGAGCEWLHVDFEDHLRAFYFDSCGFTPTNAGLIAL